MSTHLACIKKKLSPPIFDKHLPLGGVFTPRHVSTCIPFALFVTFAAWPKTPGFDNKNDTLYSSSNGSSGVYFFCVVTTHLQFVFVCSPLSHPGPQSGKSSKTTSRKDPLFDSRCRGNQLWRRRADAQRRTQCLCHPPHTHTPAHERTIENVGRASCHDIVRFPRLHQRVLSLHPYLVLLTPSAC